MPKIDRTDSTNIDFQNLVKELDQYLAVLDGEDHAFYSTFNTIQTIRHVVLAYEDGMAVGCGAFKHYSKECAEIKRMFVLPAYRGKGIAETILHELETWAKTLNHEACILETGKNNPAAIQLYKKSGYYIIPNYGQYEKVDASICMKKIM